MSPQVIRSWPRRPCGDVRGGAYPARSRRAAATHRPTHPRAPCAAPRRPGRPAWPGIPGTSPWPAPRPAETRRRTAPDPPCTADPGSAPKCPARRRRHRPTAPVPSPLVPRSAAPCSAVPGRPSSGVRCGLAPGRPLPAQRPADRADRGGQRRAELTEPGGHPAELGVGGPDLGRGLAAFGLVDAVVGINHHRLPKRSLVAASGGGPPAPRSPRAARIAPEHHHRDPVCTTNAPGPAGPAIAVKYQNRRKPPAAASGKSPIFAARPAYPAPKALGTPRLDRGARTTARSAERISIFPNGPWSYGLSWAGPNTAGACTGACGQPGVWVRTRPRAAERRYGTELQPGADKRHPDRRELERAAHRGAAGVRAGGRAVSRRGPAAAGGGVRRGGHYHRGGLYRIPARARAGPFAGGAA